MSLPSWFDWLGQWLSIIFEFLAALFSPDRHPPRYGRRKRQRALNAGDDVPPLYRRTAPKPDWVSKEIIRMKALMPDTGCRYLANSFNRRFKSTKNMTVGKTYVSNTLRKHRHQIQILRKQMKHRPPRPVPRNLVWAVDLTGKTDDRGKLHTILGIVEHQSRATMVLAAVKDKTAITLLRYLLEALERYGKPKMIRTDNEAVFTSRLFRLALWLLDIRHQRIERHCPWQNGKVERFFGTLKQKLNNWDVDSRHQLGEALGLFRFWYNHVRPHQYLNGKTPAEVWDGRNIYSKAPKQEYWFEAWAGLLQGFYIRV